MIRRIVVILVVLLAINECRLLAQVKWLHTISGNNDWDVIEQHALYSKGNIIAVGYFHGTITAGNFTLTSKDESDIFLYKSDKDGNVLWAHSLGGPVYSGDVGVAVDKDDNIYVAGGFIQELYFDNTLQLTALNSYWNSFIGKLNEEGNVLWIKGILAQT